MRKHILTIFIILQALTLNSCYVNNRVKTLNLTNKEIKYLKEDVEIFDSIISSFKYYESDRIKYRLDKFLNGTYDKKKLLLSLQLEEILGSDFEFSDSIPTNSPKINDMDSLRMFKRTSDSLIDNMMKNIRVNSININKLEDTLK